MAEEIRSSLSRQRLLRGEFLASIFQPILTILQQSDRLMVSDPAALKHILHDPTTFERSTQQQEMVNMLIGQKAVFYVKGVSHSFRHPTPTNLNLIRR